ncbi:MAG: hypothetical protein ABI142_11935 [Bryocella sp.]
MTVSKRIRLLKIGLIFFNLGEIFLALMDLLTNVSIGHVLLIYGTQIVLFDALIISTLRRLKRESQPTTVDANVIPQKLNPKSRVKLLFILVNVTIPLWTLYLARNFSISMEIVIAIVSAIFLNLALYLAIRSQRRKIRSGI